MAPTEWPQRSCLGTNKSTTDVDFTTNINLSMMVDGSQLKQLLQVLNPPLVGVPSGTNKSTTDADFKTNVYLSKMLDCSQLTTPLGQHRWGHSVGATPLWQLRWGNTVGATPLWQVIDKNSSTINKNFVGR